MSGWTFSGRDRALKVTPDGELYKIVIRRIFPTVSDPKRRLSGGDDWEEAYNLFIFSPKRLTM